MITKDSKLSAATGCSCNAQDSVAWVNGVRIDPLTPGTTLERVAVFLSCPATHVVNHLPAHPTVLARRDPVFLDVLNRADLNVADGAGVVWACRREGFAEMRQRVYGPDFMLALMEWGVDRGLTHTFVGGVGKTLSRLLNELRRRYPGLRVAGAYAPPIRGVTADHVREDLARLDDIGDVLWVGLGTPKQQVWADLAREHAPARLILTVGAAFDFIAGVKPQAPKWMQRNGLEWAFRLATEPKRLWRRAILDNAVFVWEVLVDRRRSVGRG